MTRRKSCGQNTRANLVDHPTILSSTGLPTRLAAELQFTLERLNKALPNLKRDPMGFGKLILRETASLLRERLSIQNVASGLGALAIVLTAILTKTLAERPILNRDHSANEAESVLGVSVHMQLEYNFNLY